MLVIGKDGYPSGSAECLLQQLQSLYVELEGKDGDAGCVAIRMRHGGDELAAKQVICERNDRNALSCTRCVGSSYHEHIWPRFGQLNGDLLVRSRGHAKAAAINFKIAAFHKSGLTKFIEEDLPSRSC